jgi:hypothetical protein
LRATYRGDVKAVRTEMTLVEKRLFGTIPNSLTPG